MCVDGTMSCASCAHGSSSQPHLMEKMTAVLGVADMLKGEARAAAAEACETCPDQTDCESWLESAAVRGADHAPSFCPNAETFNEIASEVPATI